jgi:hypothetical protein
MEKIFWMRTIKRKKLAIETVKFKKAWKMVVG